jgi:hypothetical protein
MSGAEAAQKSAAAGTASLQNIFIPIIPPMLDRDQE